MAHAAQLGELIGQLTTSITGLNKNDSRFGGLLRDATRRLRSSNQQRTNQFTVDATLNGLVEKFSVLNRDDLAVALQCRLDALPTATKWQPEILSLLLDLSDRPAVLSDPRDLLDLHQPSASSPVALTWEDFIATEPSDDEDDLWKDIERGYHSSGDEDVATRDSPSGSTISQATSVDDESLEQLARQHIVQPDDGLLQTTGTAHISADLGGIVSELFAIRESFCMLRGLPSSLFDRKAPTSNISVNVSSALATTAQTTIHDLLSTLACLGTELSFLRSWTNSPQSVPYVRACQTAAAKCLHALDQKMLHLERTYASPRSDLAVSILRVMTQAEAYARPLRKLSSLVSQSESLESSCGLLDVLYGAACVAHAVDDTETLHVITDVFFAGASTYLRPVARWIKQGIVAPQEKAFFIQENESVCEDGDLWHDRYILNRGADRCPNIPDFLFNWIDAIFTAGKETMFLRHLEGESGIEEDSEVSLRNGPAFSQVIIEMDGQPLADLAQSLDTAIEQWICSQKKISKVAISHRLVRHHALLQDLEALQATLCSSSGVVFQDFADRLFDCIDNRRLVWTADSFLTDLARETIGTSILVRPGNIYASSRSSNQRASSIIHSLGSIQLEYHLPWPVVNITRERSPVLLTQVFALLLQLYRARYLLQHQFFDLRAYTQRANLHDAHSILRLRHRLSAFATLMHTHTTTVDRVLGDEMRKAMTEAEDIDAMVALYSTYRKRLEVSTLLSPRLAPIREAVTSVLMLSEKLSALWATVIKQNESIPEIDRNEAAPKTPGLFVGGQTDDTAEDLGTSFDKTLTFVTAGVRAVSRTSGEQLLESLVQELEWLMH